MTSPRDRAGVLLACALAALTVAAGGAILSRLALFWALLALALVALSAPTLVFWWVSRRTLRSLEEVGAAAARAAKGELEGDLPLPADDAVAELTIAFNRARRALASKLDDVEAERRVLLSLIGGMREGLVWVGPGRRIRLANAAFRQIFSVASDPTGHLLAEVVRNPAVMRELDAALTEGHEVRDFTFQTPGSGRSFEVHVGPIRARPSERTGGALIVFFDVTRLEALERVRRDFVANVSHELRTPLTSIKAFVETLTEDGLSDRENSLRFLEIVRKHADRMGDLIDDLTDLSLIETGAVSLDMRDVDAHDVTADVFSQVAHRAEAAGVALVNDVPSPFPLRADRRRLEQILVNLVDNGVKFNRPGGSVRVVGRRNGNAVVAVEDTGTGIPADSLEKVFHRFYRVDQARSRDVGGTGLGLAIVKHLMRLHGGEVRLESQPGRGSTFTLAFPG